MPKHSRQDADLQHQLASLYKRHKAVSTAIQALEGYDRALRPNGAKPMIEPHPQTAKLQDDLERRL
jgi:hypothetical protein